MKRKASPAGLAFFMSGPKGRTVSRGLEGYGISIDRVHLTIGPIFGNNPVLQIEGKSWQQ